MWQQNTQNHYVLRVGRPTGKGGHIVCRPNSEFGFIFIAGHLTPTFLNKVDQRELASLSTSLLGIFRGLDSTTAEINNYLTDLKNDNYFLIIRGESNALETIKTSLNAF